MKLKLLILMLVAAISLSAISCASDKDEPKPEINDYYSELYETAVKNGNTYKFSFDEASPKNIEGLQSDVPGLTAAFTLRNKSSAAIVYKFSSKASAESFKTENEKLFLLYYGYVTNIHENVLIIGSEDAVALLESGSVIEVLDWCEYKDTRDTEERELHTVRITVKDHGAITVLLDATTAPVTVANFLKLAGNGFYDGLTFHRIIENFMIQGGCPNGDGTGDADETIKGEFSSNDHDNDIKHIRGVISMARGNDVNSASCQFFICNDDSPHLDGSYAAFGYVIEGMSVVDSITAATAQYGDSNGTIAIKALQAVIEKVEIID